MLNSSPWYINLNVCLLIYILVIPPPPYHTQHSSTHIQYSRVEPVLKDRPVSHKKLWSLKIGKCSNRFNWIEKKTLKVIFGHSRKVVSRQVVARCFMTGFTVLARITVHVALRQ